MRSANRDSIARTPAHTGSSQSASGSWVPSSRDLTDASSIGIARMVVAFSSCSVHPPSGPKASVSGGLAPAMAAFSDPLVLVRALHFAATCQLFGLLVFRAAVGWPETIRRPLAWAASISLALALLSGVAWIALLVAQALVAAHGREGCGLGHRQLVAQRAETGAGHRAIGRCSTDLVPCPPGSATTTVDTSPT